MCESWLKFMDDNNSLGCHLYKYQADPVKSGQVPTHSIPLYTVSQTVPSSYYISIRPHLLDTMFLISIASALLLTPVALARPRVTPNGSSMALYHEQKHAQTLSAVIMRYVRTKTTPADLVTQTNH
jgi:hypothetical protein